MQSQSPNRETHSKPSGISLRLLRSGWSSVRFSNWICTAMFLTDHRNSSRLQGTQSHANHAMEVSTAPLPRAAFRSAMPTLSLASAALLSTPFAASRTNSNSVTALASSSNELELSLRRIPLTRPPPTLHLKMWSEKQLRKQENGQKTLHHETGTIGGARF